MPGVWCRLRNQMYRSVFSSCGGLDHVEPEKLSSLGLNILSLESINRGYSRSKYDCEGPLTNRQRDQ
jgi:hypothetical protein